MSADLVSEALISRSYTRVYANIAGITLIIYDYFLTLPDEVRLIWPAKWSVGKITFFLTRYIVFIDVALIITKLVHPDATPTSCKQLSLALGSFSFVAIVISGSMAHFPTSSMARAEVFLQVIMMMRVYAIWGTKKGVLIFLSIVGLIFFIIGPAYATYDGVIELHSLDFLLPSFSRFHPCVLINWEGGLIDDYILIMGFEFICAVMTLWKWNSGWRQSESSLAKTLFKNSLQTFVCMFVISFANILAIKVVDMSGLLYMIQVAFHSILSARILLDVRRVAHFNNSQEDSNMSFSGFPKNDSVVVDVSQMNFQDRTTYDSFGSSGSQRRITESGLGIQKDENAGPLIEVHFTGGTICDEDTRSQVGVNSE